MSFQADSTLVFLFQSQKVTTAFDFDTEEVGDVILSRFRFVPRDPSQKSKSWVRQMR